MPPSKSSAHPENLAGSLLLAHPAMRDPNFRRTVIFMATHSAEGAMGVVLNRPTRRTLGTVNGSFAYTPLAEVPVFIGGPVQPEQLMLVVWQMRPEGYRLFFGIDPEKATELVGVPGTHVRAFCGYSGWSAGQLESEMAQSTWVVGTMGEPLLTHAPDERLWRLALGHVGPEWMLLAMEPDEPSLN